MSIFKLHKRTKLVALLIAACCILVGVPSVESSGIGTFGFNATIYEHGCPFVWCSSSRIQASPRSIKQFGNGLSSDQLAEQYLASEYVHESLRFDPRFRSIELQYSDGGFWTDFIRWPFPKSGSAYRLNWIGLAANCVFVVIAILITVVAVEYLVKLWPGFLMFRFGFSLRTLFVAVLLFSLVAFQISSFMSNAKQIENLERVQTFVDNWEDGYISFDWDEFSSSTAREEVTHNLPLLISNLFDNRIHKLIFPERYQAPHKIDITLWDGFRLPQLQQDLEVVIESWRKLAAPVEFAAGQTDFTNELLEFFNLTDGSKIRRLELCYDGYFDDPENQTLWKKSAPLNASFRDLEELSIVLSPEFDSAIQLKPFVELTQLTKIEIDYFDERAARQLLNSRLTKGLVIEIGYSENGLSPEVLREFEVRFKLDNESRIMLERDSGTK